MILKNNYVLIRRTDTESNRAEVLQIAPAVDSVEVGDLVLTTDYHKRAAVLRPGQDVIDVSEIVAVFPREAPDSKSPYR